MSQALPWKLLKDVLSGDQRGWKPIEQSPLVAKLVLSSTMNDGGSHPHPQQPQPQPQPDILLGQKPLHANAGTTSAQQPALVPLPAQNISGARKAQRTRRRRNRKFSTVAEVHAAATSLVAAPDDQMAELEEQPRPNTRRRLIRKTYNDPPEWGKAGDHQQVKKGKEVIVGSDDQVITKDDFVQGFMNLRPRIKGQNGSTSVLNNLDDQKNGFIDFSLSLSKKEFEEDFLAMTDQKPRQRPTLKRPRAVQKRINGWICISSVHKPTQLKKKKQRKSAFDKAVLPFEWFGFRDSSLASTDRLQELVM